MRQIKIGLLSLLVAVFAMVGIAGIAMADGCYNCHGDHAISGIEQTEINVNAISQTQIGQEVIGLFPIDPTEAQLIAMLTGGEEYLCAYEAYQDGTSGTLSGVIANGNGAGGNAQTNINVEIHQGWLDGMVTRLGTGNELVVPGTPAVVGGSHTQGVGLAA